MKGFCIMLFCILVCLPPIPASALSLNVTNGDVRDVLSSLASLGGADIVLEDAVSGNITLRLNDVEFADALELITRANGLVYEVHDNIIVIGTQKSIKKGFSSMHVFHIKFADPDILCNAVTLSLGEEGFASEMQNIKNGTSSKEKEAKQKDNVGSNRLLVDRATNSLLLYGTNTEAEAARKLIEKLDVPTKQVSLEAKVIAIQKDAAKKLGIEWEWSKLPQSPEYTTTYESVRHSVRKADGSYTVMTEDVPKTTVTRFLKNGESVPGIISFGHGPDGHPFEFYYAATLNALITDGKASILARPNITTLQGREAVINIGGEVPIPTISTTNSTVTTSVVYRESGIILKYIPRVNTDGYITATVHTEVSSPLYVEEVKAYRFQKRSADTTVRLRDGETMVIGGLIGSEESRNFSKIPFLGDLPIIGQFFRNEKTSKSESEIMIFLTAKVVG